VKNHEGSNTSGSFSNPHLIKSASCALRRTANFRVGGFGRSVLVSIQPAHGSGRHRKKETSSNTPVPNIPLQSRVLLRQAPRHGTAPQLCHEIWMNDPNFHAKAGSCGTTGNRGTVKRHLSGVFMAIADVYIVHKALTFMSTEWLQMWCLMCPVAKAAETS
jgi:hypothetical protein